MQLNRVVLPAPFGPISAVISRRARVEGKIAHGDEPAETHGQVLDRKDLRRTHAGVSVRASCTTAAGMTLRSVRNTDGVRVETSPRGR